MRRYDLSVTGLMQLKLDTSNLKYYEVYIWKKGYPLSEYIDIHTKGDVNTLNIL